MRRNAILKTHEMKVKRLLLCALSFLCALCAEAGNDVVEWPDIPLLNVTTVGGEFPTCDVVYPPEGCLGTGITGAEYVKGRLVMTLKGETLYDTGEYVKDESGMRIKIRGNSTGASAGQKPYKIKLSKKFDMLMRGDDDYKEKDWNLLKISMWNTGLDMDESNILTALGFMVSKAVGMEFVPGYAFVNLVMNGKYMGMYYLTDAVERGDKRVDIKKTGFLIENDVYWWNEDLYFKTDHQYPTHGYTFKHPDADEVDDATVNAIRQYLNDFEDVLYSGGDISQYIDYPLFARWMVGQDVLCQFDDAGSNMYVYKDDFDVANPTSTKMKMGPLWDFDAIFKDPSGIGRWSMSHNAPYFYYDKLFAREDFQRAYKEAWDEVSPTLMDEVRRGFSELKAKYGTAIDESFSLHKTVYPDECKKSLQTQIDEMTGLMEERVANMHRLVAQYGSSGVANVVASGCNEPVRIYDVYGRQYPADDAENLPRGVYIRRNADGTTVKFMKK